MLFVHSIEDFLPCNLLNDDNSRLFRGFPIFWWNMRKYFFPFSPLIWTPHCPFFRPTVGMHSRCSNCWMITCVRSRDWKMANFIGIWLKISLRWSFVMWTWWNNQSSSRSKRVSPRNAGKCESRFWTKRGIEGRLWG